MATVDNAHPCPTPVHLMAAELVKAEGALWGANVGVRGTAD
ncbi:MULTISPECIES: SusD/RagB family nutrient-binding outer membrane lipoprotein [Rhizobium]|nr:MULTISPECIES: SusD/RagB family nutrient-binding outer membrane lipoprotein [Rhizobium]